MFPKHLYFLTPVIIYWYSVSSKILADAASPTVRSKSKPAVVEGWKVVSLTTGTWRAMASVSVWLFWHTLNLDCKYPE